MAQIIKRFCQGLDYGGKTNYMPLEDQITEMLEKHREYVVRDMTVIQGPQYKEAYVVFDVKEKTKANA